MSNSDKVYLIIILSVWAVSQSIISAIQSISFDTQLERNDSLRVEIDSLEDSNNALRFLILTDYHNN